jgi:hypothetical protein
MRSDHDREAKRELADAFARAFEAWVDTASLPPRPADFTGAVHTGDDDAQ